jgi:hypothetical protein
LSKIIEQIRELLKDFSEVTNKTEKHVDLLSKIDYCSNPLNPNLLAYCFDVILGFDVKYRIFEKVDYVIEFDYKGTYGRVGHYKLSFDLFIETQYISEIINLFQQVKPLLEQAFLEIGKDALTNNDFTMENESVAYQQKFSFYQDRIEKLEKRRSIIFEKCNGQWVTFKSEDGSKWSEPKCQGYLRRLSNETIYSIETYIDVFYSYIEHILTLLWPFLHDFDRSVSYCNNYIHNPRWTWDKKIEQVCGKPFDRYIEPLRRVKEVYRNRSTHGMFSRELKIYIGIPAFGRYPMYIGKQYLRGFIEDNNDNLSYEEFIKIRKLFNDFLCELDATYEIPMLFIKSGLPIPVDTDQYINNINNADQAEHLIEKLWYMIDNLSNMDW